MPRMGAVIEHIYTLLHREASPSADGDLLNQFVESRDQAAFATLVERYQSLVMGVCSRVLRDRRDAEDAFQATFVILARKAASLNGTGTLARWLHTVALHTSLKAKERGSRRQQMERQVAVMPEPLTSEDGWSEIKIVLDEELDQLPARYRLPVVLHFLMGKSNEEAGKELGCSRETVRRRLEAACELLRVRFARRGVMLSSAILTAALAGQAAQASAAVSFVKQTITTAISAASPNLAAGVLSDPVAALVNGGMRQMFISRVKIAAALVIGVLVIGAGAGLVARDVLADKPASAPEGKGRDKKTSRQQQAGKKKAADAAPAEDAADEIKLEPKDKTPRIGVAFTDSSRFGLTCPGLPIPQMKGKSKQLTRSEDGLTNNTVVWIEGFHYLFGTELPRNQFAVINEVQQKNVAITARKWQSVMDFADTNIRVVQTVEIVLGEQTQLYDTALVTYQVWNRDQKAHTVGLRAMLDTFVGATDGVPVFVPPAGQNAGYLVDSMKSIRGMDLPSFLRMIEGSEQESVIGELNLKPAAAPPKKKKPVKREPVDEQKVAGLLADLDSDQFAVRNKATTELMKLGKRVEEHLKNALAGKPSLEARRRLEQLLNLLKPKELELGGKLEQPVQVVICRWPDNSEVRWSFNYTAMNQPPGREKDSCVVLYWDKVHMNPDEKRMMVYSYGLGRIARDQPKSTAANGKLRLLTGGSTKAGNSFIVTAHVLGGGGKVKLDLPEGLALDGDQAEQPVPQAAGAQTYIPVSWRVKSSKPGTFTLKATLAGTGTAECPVTIRNWSRFD